MKFHEELDDLLEDCNENHKEPAPEELQRAHKELVEAFYNYMDKCSEYEWKTGYLYGFKHIRGAKK